MTNTTDALRTLARNRARVDEIVRTIARDGYASWVSAGLPDSVAAAAAAAADEDAMAMSDGERAHRICVELGTTFIKIGQVLSTRSDLVGSEMAQSLQSLQAEVPPDDEDELRATVREELGAELEDVFAAFDPDPLGSASIGQVRLRHRSAASMSRPRT